MKTLGRTRKQLQGAGRWDIDFHLPPEGIRAFPTNLLKRIDDVADLAKGKRDPGKNPDAAFVYVDISAVDVATGAISNPQDMEGAEAPSRARKVLRAFDILVSTCRPTRGAISVVPPRLHNQIASTGFSIVRAKKGINPFYLHYALRLPSTLEQFRKWSTGSSYPAILDSDVKKTLIPVPEKQIQDEIAGKIMKALGNRSVAIRAADRSWAETLNSITATIAKTKATEVSVEATQQDFDTFLTDAIDALIESLPAIVTDKGAQFDEVDDEPDLLAVVD